MRMKEAEQTLCNLILDAKSLRDAAREKKMSRGLLYELQAEVNTLLTLSKTQDKTDAPRGDL